MKKKKILLKLASVTTLLTLLLTATTSCNEDKDDDTKNSDITGTYTGKANVTVAGTPFLSDHPATAIVTQGNDVNKASLVINANDLPPLGEVPIGNITINGNELTVKTTTTNGLFSLEGDVPFELPPLVIQPMTLKLTGDVNANTLTVTLVSDGQVAIVTFTGTK